MAHRVDCAPPRVAVVGIGRVGLPLALCFADQGLTVLGVDRDAALLDRVSAGRMPFDETGMQEVMDRVHATGRLRWTADVAEAASADYIVLTLGTPALSHIEIDVSQIRAVLDVLMPHLRIGQTVILRSTIAPGTTEFVAGYLAKRRGLRPGIDIHVATAPSGSPRAVPG